jgi:hypothetical protein
LQRVMHAPHLMHRVESITWGCLTWPEMQLTGQLRAQAVQPTHFSGRIR